MIGKLEDFCFFAGEPMEALVMYKPEWCRAQDVIMVPQDKAWAKLIETCYQDKAKKVSRYAIKKEPDIFDLDKLRKAQAALPEGYEITMIDEEIYHQCKQADWCSDLISQFSDYASYKKQGLAYICGARLILECLDRNLYPSWDAQNKWSVALAEKLGYHYSHTYSAYEISEY